MSEIEAGSQDEALKRLAQYFEAGAGADDALYDQHELGRRALSWAWRAESLLKTDDKVELPESEDHEFMHGFIVKFPNFLGDGKK